MKKLLSVLVAAAFAAAGFNAIAQSKDVATKAGPAVKDKTGTAVQTKEPKERAKGGPAPTITVEKKPKKEKTKGTEVKTKSGGPVKSGDKKDITTTK